MTAAVLSIRSDEIPFDVQANELKEKWKFNRSTSSEREAAGGKRDRKPRRIFSTGLVCQTRLQAILGQVSGGRLQQSIYWG